MYRCDFLTATVVDESESDVPGIGSSKLCNNQTLNDRMDKTTNDEIQSVSSLPRHYYDAVFFSLVLDYIPCPDARMDCCRKAYDLLKPGGLLIIVNPCSLNGAINGLLFKFWQRNMANIGFSRVSKLKRRNFRGQVFRKDLIPTVCKAEIDFIDKDIKGMRGSLAKMRCDVTDEDVTEFYKGLYFLKDLQLESNTNESAGAL